MRKSYIELLSKVFIEYHKDLKDEAHKLSELIDKTMVWLIGLSTGTIILLITSAEKFSFLSKPIIAKILFLLIGSIILGILGRIFMVISTRLSYTLSSLFDIQLKIYEIPYYPRELKGTETLDDIYQALQEDFNVELKSLLDIRNSHPNFDKEILDKTAREFYTAYSEWSKEDFESAFKKINLATIAAFGFKDDFFEKQKKVDNRPKGLASRVLLNGSQILYILSALAFILALVILSYKFIY